MELDDSCLLWSPLYVEVDSNPAVRLSQGPKVTDEMWVWQQALLRRRLYILDCQIWPEGPLMSWRRRGVIIKKHNCWTIGGGCFTLKCDETKLVN
jgi:hypothetical protein